MITIEDFFKVEEIYILNAYFDETDKERLIRRLKANESRVQDVLIKDTLQLTIEKIEKLSDFEFEKCMESLPYEEFQTKEEIEREKEELLIKNKQKLFIEEYGIITQEDFVDNDDLHE